MSIYIPKQELKEREDIPEGIYQSICVGVWDLGMQENKYMPQEKPKHKLIIAWEVNKRLSTGEYKGQRFHRTKKYTASHYEQAQLYKDLTSWLGSEYSGLKDKYSFDIETLIGRNCMLNFKKNEAGFINIVSITGLMEGMNAIIAEKPQGKPYPWVQKLIDEGLPVVPKTNEQSLEASEPIDDVSSWASSDISLDDMPK